MSTVSLQRLSADDVPRSGRTLSPIAKLGLRLLVLTAGLAAWHLAMAGGLLTPRVFAGPVQVAGWLHEWFVSGEAFNHISFTVGSAALGYVVGLVAAVVIASVFVFLPFVGRVFDPFMALFNGVPKIVLAPFMMLLFGIGVESKIAMAALMVFFVTFFNFASGLRGVDRVLIDNTRVLGARSWHRARDVYLPAMAKWTVASLRIGLAYAIFGAVVAEFIGSTRGVGWSVKLAGELAQPERLLGGLITLGLIALMIDLLISTLEARAGRWSMR